MTTYKPDHHGIRDMLTSDAMRALLTKRAEKGAKWARQRAESYSDSGEFAASIHVEQAGIQGKRHDRVEVDLVASSDDAAPDEFGNSHRKAHGTLAAAVRIIEEG